ncbi:MAG: excinuclease ABC subunit C [Saprospiraceae bacterium]|nr:excinuclease ABC subunit C [Saprospiraceae bacterium]
MTYEEFTKIAEGIPRDPGVYKFIGQREEILYVGKAKSLRNRLGSYFGDKKYLAAKTKALVRNALKIEYTLTENEQDAFLLENSLIKTHQPKYNVMLKDGKTYAYICIKKEAFPRVFFTRRVIKDGSTYFGPYASKYKAEIIMELVKKLFPLRTCALNLAPELIAKGKYKVCLEYHIKNCMGPCQQFESQESYDQKIQQIKNILKGQLTVVRKFLVEQMELFAQNMEFEKAHESKLQLTAFEDYQGKSTVVSTSIRDVDVFSIASTETEAYIHFMKVIDGAVIHTYTMEAAKNCDEDETQILSLAIPRIREKFDSIAPEIVVPFNVVLDDLSLQVVVPKLGDKKKLLDLSNNNIEYYKLQKRKEQINKTGKLTHAERILHTLKEDLNMEHIPVHIECFDNSNIQGTNPVASCVVFKNARPSNKDYRHFNIKTVVGPDDFASMEEVVYRRYRRMLDENLALPQLVVIDGGKGQLSAAMNSIEKLGLEKRLTVIGIAKRLEEIYFPNDSIPLHINKKSESLKLIQQLRNEAHRFGLNFHRNQRSRKFIQSELAKIKGVGEKTITKLIKQFGSVEQIKKAAPDDITSLVGKDICDRIRSYFDMESDANPKIDENEN